MKLTKLAELAVGDQQLAEGPQALQSLLAIALSLVLGDGRVGTLNILVVVAGGLPDEVLQQVAIVLGQKQLLGLLDDVPGVLDEVLAFFRELVRGTRQGAGAKERVQGDIDLFIGGNLALLESADDAEDLQLAVDVGLLLLLDNGTVDVGRHDGGLLLSEVKS